MPSDEQKVSGSREIRRTSSCLVTAQNAGRSGSSHHPSGTSARSRARCGNGSLGPEVGVGDARDELPRCLSEGATPSAAEAEQPLAVQRGRARSDRDRGADPRERADDPRGGRGAEERRWPRRRTRSRSRQRDERRRLLRGRAARDTRDETMRISVDRDRDQRRHHPHHEDPPVADGKVARRACGARGSAFTTSE